MAQPLYIISHKTNFICVAALFFLFHWWAQTGCYIISECFLCPLIYLSQAAELAPTLQADMEVKEAIQGAIQGENGEVVQIVTSVATWKSMCSLTQPRTLSHTRTPHHDLMTLSGPWEVNKCIQYSQVLYHTFTVIQYNQAHKSENPFNIYWRSLGKRHFLFYFIFLFFLQAAPTRCHFVEMFTENLKRPWYSKINCGLSGVFIISGGPSLPRNTLFDCCLSREGAAFADHHPATPSAQDCLHQLGKIMELFGVELLG